MGRPRKYSFRKNYNTSRNRNYQSRFSTFRNSTNYSSSTDRLISSNISLTPQIERGNNSSSVRGQETSRSTDQRVEVHMEDIQENTIFDEVQPFTTALHEDQDQDQLNEDGNLSEDELEKLPPIDILSILGKKSINHNLCRKKMQEWQSLYAILKLCTSTSTRRTDYEDIRDIVSWKASKNELVKQLPHYDAVNSTLRPWVLHQCAPTLNVIFAEVQLEKAGARVMSSVARRRSNIAEGIRGAPILYVKPSDYARLDLANPEIYNLYIDYNRVQSPLFLNSPILTDRYRFLKGINSSISCQRSGSATTERAYTGTSLIIKMQRGQQSLPINNELVKKFRGRVRSDCEVELLGILQQSRLFGARKDIGFSNSSCEATWTLVENYFRDKILTGDHVSLIIPHVNEENVQNVNTFLMVVSTPGPPKLSQFAYLCTLHNGSLRQQCDKWIVQCVGVEEGRNINGNELQSYKLSGYLDNGTRYILYPFWIYCDDFNETFGKVGSAGGCYILPVGIPRDYRRSGSAIRVIGLTGPGVSSNTIVMNTVEDIVIGSTKGLNAESPEGESIMIFLDCLGFISDYIEVNHKLDVLSVGSNVPCHLCTFTRGSKKTRSSQFGFPGFKTLHSLHDALVRTSERTELFRSSSSFNKETSKYRGLKFNQEGNDNPLHYLEVKLKEYLSSGREDGYTSPVKPYFDPYRSTMIGIDHLLTGLGEDCLNNAFQSLPSDEAILIMECFIIDVMKQVGISRQRTIYNLEKQRLHSLSISDMYAIIQAAPIAFHVSLSYLTSEISGIGKHKVTANSMQMQQSISLLSLYSKIVSFTISDLDKTTLHDKPDSDIQKILAEHNNEGKHLVQRYVEAVNSLIESVPNNVRGKGHHQPTNASESVQTKSGFRPRLTLDNKPNIHRLLECYYHTLAGVGHSLEVVELPFENKHQVMKRGIKKKGNDPQVTSMLSAVVDYWVAHLKCIFNMIRTYAINAEHVSDGEKNTLSKEVIGRYASKILLGASNATDDHESLFNNLYHMMESPLKRLIGKSNNYLLNNPRTKYFWKGIEKDSISRSDCLDSSMMHMRELFTRYQVYSVASLDKLSMNHIKICKGARFLPKNSLNSAPDVKHGITTGTMDFSRHFELRNGSVIRGRYREDGGRQVLYPSEEELYWCIQNVYECRLEHSVSVATVYPVDVTKYMMNCDYPLLEAKVSRKNLYYLLLSKDIKKCGLLHKCSPESCQVEKISGYRRIRHSHSSPIDGGLWFVLGGEVGFPPRSA